MSEPVKYCVSKKDGANNRWFSTIKDALKIFKTIAYKCECENTCYLKLKDFDSKEGTNVQCPKCGEITYFPGSSITERETVYEVPSTWYLGSIPPRPFFKYTLSRNNRCWFCMESAGNSILNVPAQKGEGTKYNKRYINHAVAIPQCTKCHQRLNRSQKNVKLHFMGWYIILVLIQLIFGSISETPVIGWIWGYMWQIQKALYNNSNAFVYLIGAMLWVLNYLLLLVLIPWWSAELLDKLKEALSIVEKIPKQIKKNVCNHPDYRYIFNFFSNYYSETGAVGEVSHGTEKWTVLTQQNHSVFYNINHVKLLSRIYELFRRKKYFTAIFEVSEGGKIDGSFKKVIQTLMKGQSSSTVYAIPDKGYKFVGWKSENKYKSRKALYNLIGTKKDIKMKAVFEPSGLTVGNNSSESKCFYCDKGVGGRYSFRVRLVKGKNIQEVMINRCKFCYYSEKVAKAPDNLMEYMMQSPLWLLTPYIALAIGLNTNSVLYGIFGFFGCFIALIMPSIITDSFRKRIMKTNYYNYVDHKKHPKIVDYLRKGWRYTEEL